MTGFRILILFTCFLSAPILALGTDNIPEEECDPVPETATPLAEVVPQCMAERRPTRDPIELIQQDLRVCRCLQERNALFPQALINPRPSTSTDSIRRYAESTANNMAMSSITAASTNENATSIALGVGIGEIRGFMQSERGATLPPEADPKISRDMANIDEIPEANRDNQCVTYLEYSAQRELPYDNTFFNYLRQTTRFIAADWNMDSLRTAYDAASTPEAKRAIQARMVFLARNSSYASIFQTGAIEGIPPETVSARQAEFFRILRTLAPASAGCEAVDNQCWRDSQSSGAYGRFSEDAEEFLLRDDVMDIVSAQSAARYIQNMRRMSQANPDSLIPDTVTGYMNYLQSAQQEIAFGCAGPTAQASCYERFADHCIQVRKLSDKAATSSTGDDLIDELESAQVVHGLINPQQNQSFDAFNDMICRQQYRNAAGQASNYFEYRNRVCPTGTTDPACSDRREILARYLREYNVDSNIGNVNIRAGFMEALKRPEFVQLTLQQIEAVNRVAENPRELRARFGGRMPAISGNGQLIIPTGSTSRTAPVTPSVSGSSSGGGSGGGSSEQSSSASISPANGDSRITRRPPPSQPDRFAGSDDGGFDRQRQRVQEGVSASPLLREGTQNLLTGPQGQTFQPQPDPRALNQPQRRPASEDESIQEAQRTSVSSQGLIQASGGGGGNSGSAVAPGASVISPTRLVPAIELPRRKNRNRRSDDIRRALLAKYENVSEDQATADQQELLSRTAVAVPVPPEIVADAKNDPNSLSDVQSVMEAVTGSPDPVVKICVELCETPDAVVVYAAKSESGVSFSFTPPQAPVNSRLPASLGENEMNVRLPDQSTLQIVGLNPAALGGYESVVRSAMALPGDVVRLNVYVTGQEPILVYVDKRGPTPVFTTDDQQIIRAYRP